MSKTVARSVFINCPFDANFRALLRPLVFTIVYLGYQPRIASETSDSGELRLNKIKELIRSSKFSVHDLSRIQAKKGGEFYRLNMAFELGLEFGCREFGTPSLKAKRCLVLGEKPYAHMKALSDIAGMDIQYHRGKPASLIRCVRNWFVATANVSSAPSPNNIWYDFADFMLDFSDTHKKKGFSRADIDDMPIKEYIAYMKKWAKRHTAH